MAGRGSLIVILGFSIVFGIASMYWNRTSNQATTNYIDYYDTTTAYNIALAAANIMCDTVYFAGWGDSTISMATKNFAGGLPDSTRGTYTIKNSTVWYRGCEYVLAMAIGTYITTIGDTDRDTVQVLFEPRNFAGYADFSQNENGLPWMPGDTINGPFHTNDALDIDSTSDGYPIFTQKASSVGNINQASYGNDSRIFRKGYQHGGATNVTMPNSLTSLLNNASSSGTFSGPAADTGSSYAYDVYLTFKDSNGTGWVTITDTTRKKSGSTWISPTNTVNKTVTLSSLADSNGQAIIAVTDGDVHVNGKLRGSATVVANKGRRNTSTITTDMYFNGSKGTNISGEDGNVLIDGSIQYHDNLGNNPNYSGNDMLGLVGYDNVAIDIPNNTSGVSVDAAVFAMTGDWTNLRYNSQGYQGYIFLLGSITNQNRGQVQDGGIDPKKLPSNPGGNGYLKSYNFDTRFYNGSPPLYPAAVKPFQIVSWRE
jgi:hypothetical protein